MTCCQLIQLKFICIPLLEEEKYFLKFEDHSRLARSPHEEPRWLQNEQLARKWAESMSYLSDVRNMKLRHTLAVTSIPRASASFSGTSPDSWRLFISSIATCAPWLRVVKSKHINKHSTHALPSSPQPSFRMEPFSLTRPKKPLNPKKPLRLLMWFWPLVK